MAPTMAAPWVLAVLLRPSRRRGLTEHCACACLEVPPHRAGMHAASEPTSIFVHACTCRDCFPRASKRAWQARARQACSKSGRDGGGGRLRCVEAPAVSAARHACGETGRPAGQVPAGHRQQPAGGRCRARGRGACIAAPSGCTAAPTAGGTRRRAGAVPGMSFSTSAPLGLLGTPRWRQGASPASGPACGRSPPGRTAAPWSASRRCAGTAGPSRG
mmetsp:Transcript_39132/g.98628  ORF Transcript_39132/g.98628 Transcript_39132/m.98628 type:complete len:217 (+) Transcript_39132:307-957(+)